jgi:hypothetical protein
LPKILGLAIDFYEFRCILDRHFILSIFMSPIEEISSVVNSTTRLIRVSAANLRRLCALVAILLVFVAYLWITKKQPENFNPKATAMVHSEANAATALAAPVTKSQADVVNVQVSPTFLASQPTTENRSQITDAEQERYDARVQKLLDQAFSLPSPSPPSQTEINGAQAMGELYDAERAMMRYDVTSDSFAAQAARERYKSAWKRLGLKPIPDP